MPKSPGRRDDRAVVAQHESTAPASCLFRLGGEERLKQLRKIVLTFYE